MVAGVCGNVFSVDVDDVPDSEDAETFDTTEETIERSTGNLSAWSP